jgi:hypothetical protein
MKSHTGVAILCVAAMAFLHADSQSHSFSVRDDIAMVRFVDPRPDGLTAGSENVKLSPDGKHFAFVTTRGLLDTDQIESDLYLFDRGAVSAFAMGNTASSPPAPRRIATVVSFPHREEAHAYAAVIKDIRWSPDMRHIYFRGEAQNGNYQLYEANLNGTSFHALTSNRESVDHFDLKRNLIAFTVSSANSGPTVPSGTINRDAQDITGRDILDVLFPHQIRTIEAEKFGMAMLRRTKTGWKRTGLPLYSVTERSYLSFLYPYCLSPRGDQVISLVPLRALPHGWDQYEPAAGFEHGRLHPGDPRATSDSLVIRPEQYAVTDTRTGATTPLVDAPNARVLAYLDSNRVAWAPNGDRVLVTNTFLPLVGQTPDEEDRRKVPCAVASVDLTLRTIHCLFFEQPTPLKQFHVLDVSFGNDSSSAVILSKTESNDFIVQSFAFRNGQWKLTSSVTPDLDDHELPSLDTSHCPIRIWVRQSLNDPPTLWVENRPTGKQRRLWDPNPQFQHIVFGNAALYHWIDRSGYEWSGVLVKPVNYVSGRRYPLVLQMYSFSKGLFLTDGLYPTAFAARQLASAGFVVLQIKRRPGPLSLAEPDRQLEGYRSAIENLAHAGMIDSRRVGVVGFSWTCWYVVHALIKDQKMFAASTIADGLDNSYMQYLLTSESPDIQSQIRTIYGAAPFGAGLPRWIAHAPGFNLDKVQAPVRIEAIDPASVLQEWELYASLRLQGKPVDFIYFPSGAHIHQKPLERLESQQGDVDWFCFWLQGTEDADPSKRAQYFRWRQLRKELHNDATPQVQLDVEKATQPLSR